MIIDTHAHLDCLDELSYVISNMENDNLSTIITIATNMKDSFWTVLTAESNKNIYASVGVHPSHAGEELTEKDIGDLVGLSKHEKVVAIGESGLDYHYEGTDRDKQKELFKQMIAVASKCNLPLIVHMREATQDLIQILKENKEKLKNGVVIHCFSGSADTARELTEMGFYLSFSGSITYKKTNRELLKVVPLDKILVETDSPFLPPEPLRGSKNVPKNINITAQKIADILEMSLERFSKITTENSKRLFNKIK
ncbi:MAG: TatD family hydrolase [Clostridia bacterium]